MDTMNVDNANTVIISIDGKDYAPDMTSSIGSD
jgi:hypothetical protein